VAGRPKHRAELEAARAGAPAPRRKRTARLTAAQRLAAVAAAEVEGTPVVAERLGVTASTIRGWKHLAGKADRPVAGSRARQFVVRPYDGTAPLGTLEPVSDAQMSQSPVAHPPVDDVDQTRILERNEIPSQNGLCNTDPASEPPDAVQVMQDSALETRRLAAECMSQARNALTLGESVKVKDLSMAAQKFAQQAAELENTVQAHLEARPRITQAQLGELERRLRGFLKALATRTGHDLDPDRNPDCAAELQAWFNGPTPHPGAHGVAEHAQDAPNSTDTPHP
jgi:hypothetical protein